MAELLGGDIPFFSGMPSILPRAATGFVTKKKVRLDRQHSACAPNPGLSRPQQRNTGSVDLVKGLARFFHTSRSAPTHPALSGTPLQRGFRLRRSESPLPRGVARSDGVCESTMRGCPF